MKCPACDHEMTLTQVNKTDLDICTGGCGGIWFDRFELRKFDNGQEVAPPEILNTKKDPNRPVKEGQRHCPRCKSVVMRRFYSSPKREVEIDECAQCSGVFLDTHELEKMRNEYPSEAARQADVDSFVQRALSDFKKAKS